MAAPTPTTRQTPVGIWIPKSHTTKFTMSLDPDASLWEIEVTPSGGAVEMIPQDSMWNRRHKILRAAALIERKPLTFRFHYDPIFRRDIDGLLGVERSGLNAQIITERDYDGTTRCYYGVLSDITFDPLVSNQPGTGTGTITPTNWDPINNVEEDPVFANIVGS